MRIGLLGAASLNLLLFSVVATSRIIQQHWRSGGPPDCSFSKSRNGSVVASSLVQCLVILQPHSGDLTAASFDPVTGNCESVLSGNVYVTEARVIPDRDACTAEWTKVFEIDPSGAILYGDVAAVISAVMTGVEIRIQLKPDFFMEVVGFDMGLDYVCVVAAFIFSKQSWDLFEDDVYWKLTRVCTTGMVFRMRIYIGSTNTLPQLETSEHAVWFTRTMEARTSPANPVFCTDMSKEVTHGSRTDVISAAEQGAQILVSTLATNKHLVFHGSRLQFIHNEGTCVVGILSPWFITKRRQDSAFYDPTFWNMLLLSTDGTNQVSRWFIDDHSFKDINPSFDGNMQWFVDSCWKLVYSHRENGETITGSQTTLEDLVLHGRRIRLVFDNFAMEADNIVIENGLVIVQLLSQIDTETVTTFTYADAVWKWARITSDGTYFVDLYGVGESTSRGHGKSTISASWFAEHRQWKLVLSMANTNVIQGSKSELENAIRSGTRVRCVVKEAASKIIAVTADNLEVNPTTGDIAAQFARFISFDDNDPLFIPFWRILILSTKGEMKETHWTVGEHVKRGETVTSVDIDWLVD